MNEEIKAKEKAEEEQANLTLLSDESPKVWVFIRQDIGMSKGKICSQTAHATLGLYKDASLQDPVLFTQWASVDYATETFEANSY